MAGFDPKKVTTLDWVVIGAGGLGFIDSFLPWYKVDFGPFGSASASAWDAGFAAWFSMILLLAAGALVLVAATGNAGNLPVPVPVTALALSALATLLVILRWATEHDFTSIGLYLGLILAIASAAAAFMSFRAAGGNFNQIRRTPGAPPPPGY
jgi:hypothetical protein